ncbi:MAG TPA: CDGSH iron-sulfur domain-containing protein [Holophaga sp.]|nr:CDGSH iron-sulfur domain-containing protein [Holophaga sp.]
MSEPRIHDRKPEVMTLEPGTYWWCACGLSAKQPFCDGAHKGSGLGPTRFEVEETRQVALCNCKHSGAKPFCDGAHKAL